MNLDLYKGYQASVSFSNEDCVYFGRILDIDDLISFEGDTTDQLQKAFEEAVDDYFDICQTMDKSTPDQRYLSMAKESDRPTFGRHRSTS